MADAGAARRSPPPDGRDGADGVAVAGSHHLEHRHLEGQRAEDLLQHPVEGEFVDIVAVRVGRGGMVGRLREFQL